MLTSEQVTDYLQNTFTSEQINAWLELPVNKHLMYISSRSLGRLTSYKFVSPDSNFSLSVVERSRNKCLVLSADDVFRGYSPPAAIKINYVDFDDVETAVKTLFGNFKKRWRKPASQGCVKAYLTSSKMMWVWKRPSSDKIVKVDDDWFLKATYEYMFSVWESATTTTEVAVNKIRADSIAVGTDPEIKLINGRYVFVQSLVPVYNNSPPFNSIATYILPGEESSYEYVLVDGERRFVNLMRVVAKLLRSPIHSYSTKIETLISAEHLFRKGSTDFYAKRPQDETPFLGFELEACCNKADNLSPDQVASMFKEHLPWLVMCKHDGSISDEGFETVSVPATLDFWKESDLAQTLDAMRAPPYNMRSFEHSSCGFHVHVSRSALSVLDLQKLERFLHNPDNKTFLTTVAGRGSGTYQKYFPALFTHRSAYTTTPTPRRPINESRDGLLYFGGPEMAAQDLRSRMPPSYSALVNRVRAVCQWISSNVSYESLDGLLLTYQNDYEQFREEHYLSSGDLTSELFFSSVYSAMDYTSLENNPYRTFITRWAGAGTSFEHFTQCVEKLLQFVASHSPTFAGLLRHYFPEWNWRQIVTAPLDSGDTSIIKSGLLKSPAKAGRKFNYSASQIVKGPVGKALNQRYDVLNTSNTNTVEFRLFKGTMNSSSVFRYLEFVDALVRFVAVTSARNEGVTYPAFLSWLVKDSFNVSRYEHLISFLIDKKFLNRKDVRRRTIPVVESADNKLVNALTTIIPKGFESKLTPLGSWTTTSEPVVDSEETVPDYCGEIDYDEIGELEEHCGDPDCNLCNQLFGEI